MKKFLAVAALMVAGIFTASAQGPSSLSQPQPGFNFAICSPHGLAAEHASLSRDGVLDLDYYLDQDEQGKPKVTKDVSDTHLIFKGQLSDPRKDDSVKYDGITVVPDGQGGRATLTLHGVIYKGRMVAMVFVQDKLRYALYGSAGAPEDLLKLDAEKEMKVCGELLDVGSDGVPTALQAWLHQDDPRQQN